MSQKTQFEELQLMHIIFVIENYESMVTTQKHITSK